jgi:hypothetical protein
MHVFITIADRDFWIILWNVICLVFSLVCLWMLGSRGGISFWGTSCARAVFPVAKIYLDS